MKKLGELFIRRVIYILIGMSILVYAEPSVYGFDNIADNQDSPDIIANDIDGINIAVDRNNINTVDYIIEDKDTRDRVAPTNPPTIGSLKEQIDEQAERIDGLTTVIDGLSSSLNNLKKSSNMDTDTAIENLKDDIVVIDEKDNYSDTSISPIVTPIVTSPKVETTSVYTNTSINTPIVNRPTPLSSKSNNLLFSEGVTNFLNGKYADAKERFILTDSKGYKVGTSNFYLGEISYYTKDYENAIFFYKKSAGIDDKTSFIDTLLLHTGVSFEKSGNKKKARAFYQNLIDTYPNNKTAIIAKEKLRKL